MFFELISGTHCAKGKMYKQHDVIESNVPLNKLFRGKFIEVDSSAYKGDNIDKVLVRSKDIVNPDIKIIKIKSTTFDLSNILCDGAWKGQRCFVIGGGPSLNNVDLAYLKDELVIGVNRAFERIDGGRACFLYQLQQQKRATNSGTS